MAPPGVPESRILRFVAAQREWIDRARRRAEAERRPPAERGPFPERLRLEAEGRRVAVDYRIAAREGWDWPGPGLRVRLRERDPAGARRVLVDALKWRARSTLEPVLFERAERHGLRVARVTWRNQRSRWGSCSAAGNISLNVRLLFLPRPLVEYVLIHELAHLRHPDHSARFWRCVGRMLPDYGAVRRALAPAASRVPEWIQRA